MRAVASCRRRSSVLPSVGCRINQPGLLIRVYSSRGVLPLLRCECLAALRAARLDCPAQVVVAFRADSFAKNSRAAFLVAHLPPCLNHSRKAQPDSRACNYPNAKKSRQHQPLRKTLGGDQGENNVAHNSQDRPAHDESDEAENGEQQRAVGRCRAGRCHYDRNAPSVRYQLYRRTVRRFLLQRSTSIS